MAVIECIPPISVEMVQVAVLFVVPCVNILEFVQVNVVVPSEKITEPVGWTVPAVESPVTTAVNVTRTP